MKRIWFGLEEIQKTGVLIVGFLLMGVLTYQFSFSITLSAWREHGNLKSELEKFQVNKQKLETQANIRLRVANSVSDAQVELLKKIENCGEENEISLRTLTEPVVESGEGQRLLSIGSECLGAFHNQVMTVYNLESSLSGLYVQSILMNARVNNRTKETELFTLIWYKGLIK